VRDVLQPDQLGPQPDLHHVAEQLLQPPPVIAHEGRDRRVIGRLLLEQPEHVQAVVTGRFQLATRPQAIQQAVEVQARQIARVVGWLPGAKDVFPFPGRLPRRMAASAEIRRS